MTDNMPNSEEAICRGEYGVIRSLIRVLEVNKISYLLLTFYHVSNINFIHFEVLFCREEQKVKGKLIKLLINVTLCRYTFHRFPQVYLLIFLKHFNLFSQKNSTLISSPKANTYFLALILPYVIVYQNLREAIGTYRNSILRQADEMKREASLSFFVEYLERYYFLICFAVYIHTESSALHSVSSEQKSFSDWMRARPELYSILRR